MCRQPFRALLRIEALQRVATDESDGKTVRFVGMIIIVLNTYCFNIKILLMWYSVPIQMAGRNLLHATPFIILFKIY